MNDFYLSDEEVKELTGYTTASKQKAELDKSRIPCKIAGGKCIVVRYWVQRAPFETHQEPKLISKTIGSAPDIGKFGAKVS